MKFMTVWYVIHYYCRNNKNYTSYNPTCFFHIPRNLKPVNKILDNKSPFIIPNKDAIIKTDMVNFCLNISNRINGTNTFIVPYIDHSSLSKNLKTNSIYKLQIYYE